MRSTRSNGPAEIVVDFDDASTPKRTKKTGKGKSAKNNSSSMEVDTQEEEITEPTTPMDTASPQASPIGSPINECNAEEEEEEEEEEEVVMEEQEQEPLAAQQEEKEEMYDTDDTVEVLAEVKKKKKQYKYTHSSSKDLFINLYIFFYAGKSYLHAVSKASLPV